MESPAPFDLNKSLGQWRANLQNLGGFRADELDELEAHLRESLSELHARGLAIQEAFMIATRRLGSERQLSDEFAKANPQRTWTERAMWMAAGALAASALAAVAAPLANFVLNCALWSGLNGNLAGALFLLVGWLSWIGAAAIAYRIISRHSSRLEQAIQICIQRPVLAGLGLFLGLECLQFGMSSVNRFAEPLYCFFAGHPVGISSEIGVLLSGWFLWKGVMTQLLWIAAGPLLLGLAWRKRGTFASELSISPELLPADDVVIRELQSQGLSLDEASLLLTQRRSPQAIVAPALGLAADRGLWLERAAWMATGVALSQCLEYLVLSPGWLLAIATQPVTPLFQHLAALASACLGLALAAAIIAGLWRWVTNHPSQSASIGSICHRRPVLTAIALVVVCASIALSEYALFMCLRNLMALPAQLGLGPIPSQWLRYSAALNHIIIPIALLLWLARRWRGMPTNPAPAR